MIIECKGSALWLTTLRQKYDLSQTILNDSPNSFTVLFTTHNSRKTMLVGRYCRVNHFGVVICRRGGACTLQLPIPYERRSISASTKKD